MGGLRDPFGGFRDFRVYLSFVTLGFRGRLRGCA